MTVSLRIEDGSHVDVVVALQDTVTTTVVEQPVANAVVIQGPPGPSFIGTAWWYGEGVPDVVIGSKKDDYYVDTLTGVVYRLE